MITNNKKNKRWFGIAILLVVLILITDALMRVNVAQKTPSSTKAEKSATGMDTSKNIKFTPPKIKSTTKFTSQKITDVLVPRFKGTLNESESSNAMERYINKNVRYPEMYRQMQPGFVYIKFTVSENGKIENVRIEHSDKHAGSIMQRIKFDPVNSIYVNEENIQFIETNEPAFIKEAIRIVSSMPDFEPAEDKNGKPVKKELFTKVIFDRLVIEYVHKIKDYIKNHLSYPEQAKKSKSQGIVFASFDLDKSGEIGNFSFIPKNDIQEYERKPMQPSSDPVLQEEVQKAFTSVPQFKEKLNTSTIVAHLKLGIMFHLIQSK